MERTCSQLRIRHRHRRCLRPALAATAAILLLPDANAALVYDLDAASPSGGSDINAYSRSRPFSLSDPVAFSVDRLAVGASGSGVFMQSAPASEQAHGDVFISRPGGGNILGIDEEMLGLLPGFFGDDIDALDRGHASARTFFSVDFLSASNSFGTDTLANDIFLNSLSSAFASGEINIGLASNDNIDALQIFDTGNLGFLNPGLDYAIFSLDSFSPTIVGGGFSPGDLLYTEFDGTFSLWRNAASLGLRIDDELNAVSVPEPGSVALLLVASAALLRRRRSLA